MIHLHAEPVHGPQLANLDDQVLNRLHHSGPIGVHQAPTLETKPINRPTHSRFHALRHFLGTDHPITDELAYDSPEILLREKRELGQVFLLQESLTSQDAHYTQVMSTISFFNVFVQKHGLNRCEGSLPVDRIFALTGLHANFGDKVGRVLLDHL